MKTEIPVWKLTASQGQYKHSRLALEPIPQTIDEATKQVPGGAYSTFRTYSHNKVLDFNAQINRLNESARLSQVNIDFYPDSLREILREAVRSYEETDLRIRVVLDLFTGPGDIYLAIEKLKTPAAADYEAGVYVVTRKMHRDNPKAKLTEFLYKASEVRGSIKPVEEVLMVGDNGQLLEGLSSNFFAVRKGILYTAEEGVLSGITRSAVIRCAKKAGMDVNFDPIRFAELGEIEEAFITSTSRSILPVSQIDQITIGNGRPGEMTVKLMRLFQQLIDEEAQEI